MQYGTGCGGGAQTKGSPYRPRSGSTASGGRVPGRQPFNGSVFQYLAANVIDTDTDNALLPSSDLHLGGEKLAFIGETLQGTPLIVTPTGVAGLELPRRGRHGQRARPPAAAGNVEPIVLLLHEGGTQNAPFSHRFMDVNACENFTGPDLLDIVDRLDPASTSSSARTRISRTAARWRPVVTSAASFGRVITPIDLNIERRRPAWSTQQPGTMSHPDGPKDAGTTAILASATRRSRTRSGSGSSARSQPTSCPLAERSRGQRAGEQPMGDVIADGMLEAAAPTDFGGAVAAFMNVGGVRASLFFNPISGGAAGRGHVRGGLRCPAVREHAGRQDLHRAAALRRLEQQFENPAAGQQRVMAVSNVTYTYTRVVPAGQKRVLDGSLKIGGVASTRQPATRRAEQLHRGRRRRFHRLQVVHRSARERHGHRRLRPLPAAHSPSRRRR